jgi:hypothetical protein
MFRIYIISFFFQLFCCEIMLNDEYLLCKKTESLVYVNDEQKCNFRDYNCQLFMNTLNDLKRNEGHFSKAFHDLVLFTEKNQVYQAKCDKVKGLKIQNYTLAENICLSLLPAMMQNDRIGFLTKEGIIIESYTGVTCPIADETFVFERIRFVIKNGNFFHAFQKNISVSISLPCFVFSR